MSYNKHGPSPSSIKEGIRRQSDVNDFSSETITSFYQALDCPRSLALEILYRYGEYDQLLSFEALPHHYCSSGDFRDAYLATNLLAKADFIPASFNREALALQKFEKFEEMCAQTNAFFRSYITHPVTEHQGGVAFIHKVQCKIDSILGRFSPSEWLDECSWGPGVSTLIKGEQTSAPRKFRYETGVTRDLYPLAREAIALAYPGWFKLLKYQPANFQIGNKVVTVPKTSKIDRVIAVEPGINLWFQKGLGNMIRKRLGRQGIDLNDQTFNQQRARSASYTGEYATVDMSSASDSISCKLVEALFVSTNAQDWLAVMELCRSQYGVIAGKVRRWNKFSSMGNGFTFDLQSLIFYCMACVCCEAHGFCDGDVSVFGDDVILPSKCYDSFCSFSSLFGFIVNPTKSFSTGYFRESCGSHYYQGVSCKPLYLKQRLSTVQRIYNCANTLRLRAHYPNFGCDTRFRRLFYKLTAAVPKALRFRVTAIKNSKTGEVDPLEGGFISNLDEASPSLAGRDFKTLGWEGFKFKRLTWTTVKTPVEHEGLLQARLYKASVDEEGNETPLRGRTRCRLTTMVTKQWYDLGPWI